MTLTARRDEPTTYVPPDSTLVLAAAIDRLAQALEQLVLSQLEVPHPLNARQPFVSADPYPADLPPVEIGDASATTRPVPLANCPVHHEPWKYVPAGTSKKSGLPYDAFYACPVRGCTQRPPSRG